MGPVILAVVMKPILMALLFISASLAGCMSDDESSSSAVEAIFDYDPAKNIRTGMDIDFDGGASLPSGASLTYKWDFDSDGAYDDTGRTVTWSYPDAGSYEVKLTVSDGTDSNSQSRTIKVIDADAPDPTADAGSDSPMSDCEGESVNSGSYYWAYICEMDKSTSNKMVAVLMNTLQLGIGTLTLTAMKMATVIRRMTQTLLVRQLNGKKSLRESIKSH